MTREEMECMLNEFEVPRTWSMNEDVVEVAKYQECEVSSRLIMFWMGMNDAIIFHNGWSEQHTSMPDEYNPRDDFYQALSRIDGADSKYSHDLQFVDELRIVTVFGASWFVMLGEDNHIRRLVVTSDCTAPQLRALLMLVKAELEVRKQIQSPII